MEAPPRLTPGAVKAIAELPDGAETGKPVLQVLDVRPVTTTNSERFRMALSDGVHAQQSMLATALNHLVTGGALRAGAIVHLLDMTCSTIQKRRIIIVVKLDILQSECTIIGSPKMYEMKSLSNGQEPNLPANAAQTNNGTYSSVAPRAEQVANTPSYGGPYNGVQGIMGSSIGQKGEPGPNNVFSGGSYGTVSAQNIMNANMAQPKSQQHLLNSHQNQRFAVPTAGSGIAAPGSTYGRPAQPSYQQQPLAYMNRGPVAKREAASRVIPISALNPYQSGWTIKARVTAKTDLKHYTNARGPGKVFSFDLLDAHGGEIRATCFNETLDRFYDLIQVDKVYVISRGSLKPADKRYNNLNNEYQMTLDTLTSIDICSGDDSSIPKQHFNFRQIEEIENMDKDTIVDLLGVVTSVSPSGTIMRKNGTEAQKRTLELKDMSGRSVQITLWGSLCDAEGQQLQLSCDSGLTPIIALKCVRVNDFGGRSAGTISSSLLKINPDLPEAERLREWYMTEGKTVAYVSLSQESSSMGMTGVRKTTAQIKDENLGQSEKPDWITVRGAISHLNTDIFSYPACTLEVNGKRCNKKVTNNGDGTWNCEKCDQSSPNCEHRYVLLCQIQDQTGTTYATAFQEAGEDIFGMTAQELVTIRDVEQDDIRFAAIMQGVRWQQYLFKLKVKEETFNDETRVKCNIVKAEKLDPPKDCPFILGTINNLLDDLSSDNPCMDDSVTLNAGFANVETGHSVVTPNNAYAMNMGGANQFGQQASISGGMFDPPPARQQQPPAGRGFTGSSYGSLAVPTGLCFKCNQPGHMARECSGLSNAPAPVAGSGLCFKCNQPGHFARDCPAHQRPQAYGNGGASGFNR